MSTLPTTPTSLVCPGGTYTLRPLTLEDCGPLSELNRLVSLDPWSEGAFQDTYQSGWPGWVLCNATGERIAWINFMACLDEVELLNIGVHVNYQRQGIAFTLLTYFIKGWQCQAQRMHLEVCVTNTRAQALYEKLGFQYSGRRKNYYLIDGVRLDALLMHKALQS